MKTLVFLLVLFNLLFYAYSAGHFGQPDNPDAGRADQQIAPERMRLVSHGEAPPPAKTPEPALVLEEKAPVVENICLRWSNLAVADADRLTGVVGEKFGDFKTSRKTLTGEATSWWVYIPPLPGKAEADKKAGELRDLGIRDYFVVQETGANHLAISLGVFSSEKGAIERLAELKEKGVRSARQSARPGKDSLFAIEASGPQTQKAALLSAARAAAPKAQPQDCK